MKRDESRKVSKVSQREQMRTMPKAQQTRRQLRDAASIVARQIVLILFALLFQFLLFSLFDYC